MLIDGQQSAYLPWISSWFLTDIHRAMSIFWFGVLSFVQNHSASTILKRQKNESIQVLGILPKKHFVSSLVHAAHCALTGQLYECLCDTALQHPPYSVWSHLSPPRVCCPQPLLLPGAHCPPATNTLGTERGKTSQRGPSVGCICVPHLHPTSFICILHPTSASLLAAGQAELGSILLPHTKGKTVASFGAQSCRYLGKTPQFAEVSGFPVMAVATDWCRSCWVQWGRLAQGGCSHTCLQDQTPQVHLF